jgi:apolipoprotein N-acyltransferase
MSNQKPKNEISESQLSWIFFIIFLQIYWWIVILVPMAVVEFTPWLSPPLGKLISIILGASFSAIAIRRDPSESYLKISGNMNCINNFAAPLGEVDSSNINL